MFTWRTDSPDLTRAFTDRWGGVSSGSFGELNLGNHVGDDSEAVEINRVALATAIGVPRERLVFMDQVHGRDVELITTAPAVAPVADAMVTSEPGVALTVMVADCLPMLLADPDAGVIGVAHVGRPGLALGIVDAVLAAMRSQGARVIEATLGPRVCGPCYEVPATLQAEVGERVPEAISTSATGTPALDIAAGALAQLRAAGVAAVDVGGCTRESPALFSYRRDRETGRFAGVIVRRES